MDTFEILEVNCLFNVLKELERINSIFRKDLEYVGIAESTINQKIISSEATNSQKTASPKLLLVLLLVSSILKIINPIYCNAYSL